MNMMNYFKENNISKSWGQVFSESFYNENIKGKEKEAYNYINKYDYVGVLRNGKLNFVHYSPNIIEDNIINNYNNEYSTFGPGIYVYNSDEHEEFENSMSNKYYGSYEGEYIECVYDCDPVDYKGKYYNKGEGNAKEYVLLTDKVKATSSTIKPFTEA